MLTETTCGKTNFSKTNSLENALFHILKISLMSWLNYGGLAAFMCLCIQCVALSQIM